jgi:hypothetical protein
MLIFLLHKEYDELILCLKEMASLPWQQKIFVTHEQLFTLVWRRNLYIGDTQTWWKTNMDLGIKFWRAPIGSTCQDGQICRYLLGWVGLTGALSHLLSNLGNKIARDLFPWNRRLSFSFSIYSIIWERSLVTKEYWTKFSFNLDWNNFF